MVLCQNIARDILGHSTQDDACDRFWEAVDQKKLDTRLSRLIASNVIEDFDYDQQFQKLATSEAPFLAELLAGARGVPREDVLVSGKAIGRGCGTQQ